MYFSWQREMLVYLFFLLFLCFHLQPSFSGLEKNFFPKTNFLTHKSQDSKLKGYKISSEIGKSVSHNRIPKNSIEKTLDEHHHKNWKLLNFPKVRISMDPLINFRLKQKLSLLGTCVTIGLDYLSDIAQWRSYCAIEDTFVRGRFSLRGTELSWAKSWLLNLGLGEENAAKLKLRIGLNTKTYKLYSTIRFRTEPLSPFDIGEGLTCAGKLPLPLFVVPILKSIPLRIEYRVKINSDRPSLSLNKHERNNKVFLSTGLGTVDVSLDELNFCLEWDEQSPVWGIGLVKAPPSLRFQPFTRELSSKYNRSDKVFGRSQSSNGLSNSYPIY